MLVIALVIGKGKRRTREDKSQQGKTRKALKTQGKASNSNGFGVWRSLVSRLVREQTVKPAIASVTASGVSHALVIKINKKAPQLRGVFLVPIKIYHT